MHAKSALAFPRKKFTFAVVRRADFWYNMRWRVPKRELMNTDIIAENQTERTIQSLMNGDADSKTQQAALAAVLRATTKQALELEEIKQNLWKPGDLEKAVESQLRLKCQSCPAKQAMRQSTTQEKESHNWFAALLTSESFRYFLLIVMFAWALILISTGKEGMKAIGEETRATVTGGLSK